MRRPPPPNPLPPPAAVAVVEEFGDAMIWARVVVAGYPPRSLTSCEASGPEGVKAIQNKN